MSGFPQFIYDKKSDLNVMANTTVDQIVSKIKKGVLELGRFSRFKALSADAFSKID